MFNKTIFFQSIKNNGKLWVVLTTVICFFACMIAIMASTMPTLNLPGSTGGKLIDVYAGAFYGMMGLILFIVYTAFTGNNLVAKEVDKGSLSYTLNTPITRKEVIFSKAMFYLISIFLMVAVLAVVGIVSNAIFSTSELDNGKFLLINLGLFCYLVAISGLCFFASCFCNKVSHSLSIGAGLTLGFFLINTIASFGGDLEFFKYFTINSLFDTQAIISGSGFVVQFIVLLVVGILLYAVGINKFLKKDLPL